MTGRSFFSAVQAFISAEMAACCFGACLVCVLPAFSTCLLALDDQPESQAEQGQVIGRLIQQLGEPSFEVREQATQRLVEIGSLAEPALTEESKNPDPEIQFRCRQIIAQIAVLNFERRLEGFLLDDGENGDHLLPAWTRFQRAYGSAPAAKKLFVLMQRTEPELMSKLEENDANIEGFLSERITDRQQRMRYQPIDLAGIASILFAAAEDDVDLGPPAAQIITSFCYQPSFRAGIADESESRPALEKMLERWLSRDNAAVVQQGVMLALQYDLPVGLKIARRVLQDDGGVKHMQLYAMLAIGKLGHKGDTESEELLKGKFEDNTLLTTTKINNKTMQTQARDVALAAFLHLQGQDPKQFGFDNVQEQPIYLYAPHTLGFENDEQRAAAFEKWKEFSEAKATESN